ncbi:MAG: hypothetical protein M1814_003432 [Vezdaea aestivalis]|nr:MAG: hypothetical protein M1814_003432 [Vezdaea aestivalis]
MSPSPPANGRPSRRSARSEPKSMVSPTSTNTSQETADEQLIPSTSSTHSSGHHTDDDGKDDEDCPKDEVEQPAAFAPSRRATRSNNAVFQPSSSDTDRETKGKRLRVKSQRAREMGLQAPLKKPASKKRSLSKTRSNSESSYTPRKKPNTRRSTTSVSFTSSPPTEVPASETESDDDLYNRVDLISESDDDDPDIEKAEERLIIDSEEEDAFRLGLDFNLSSSPILTRTGQDSTDFDNPIHPSDSVLFSDVRFFEDQYQRLNYHRADTPDFNLRFMRRSRSPMPPTKPKGRVRFEEIERPRSSDNSTETSEDEVAFIPDNLSIHEPIKYSSTYHGTTENSTDGSDSQWDLRDQYGGFASASSYSEDSGGDTTDEDMPGPPTIIRPRSVLRRPSTSSLDRNGSGSLRAFRRSMRPPPRPKTGPAMGSWVADPYKPIAIIDKTGKKILITAKRCVPPYVPTSGSTSSGNSVTNDSPHRSSFRISAESENECSDSSFVAKVVSANLAFNKSIKRKFGNDISSNGHFMALAEALYASLDDDVDINDDEDDENLWDINDILNFGDASSSDNDGDGEMDDDSAITSPTTPFATPVTVPATPVIPTFSFEPLQQSSHRRLLPPRLPFYMDDRVSKLARSAVRFGRDHSVNEVITPPRRQRTDARRGPPTF